MVHFIDARAADCPNTKSAGCVAVASNASETGDGLRAMAARHGLLTFALRRSWRGKPADFATSNLAATISYTILI